jgi:hypothetical protein
LHGSLYEIAMSLGFSRIVPKAGENKKKHGPQMNTDEHR